MHEVLDQTTRKTWQTTYADRFKKTAKMHFYGLSCDKSFIWTFTLNFYHVNQVYNAWVFTISSTLYVFLIIVSVVSYFHFLTLTVLNAL